MTTTDVPQLLSAVVSKICRENMPGEKDEVVAAKTVDTLLEAAMLVFRAEQVILAKPLNYYEEQSALGARLIAVLRRDKEG